MNRFQFATVALIALSLVSSISAQGDSSHGLYAEALARERVLRDPRRLPSLSELRSAVELYESLLRPGLQTGYEDRALWQAAGLATEAYDRFRQAKDLEIGKRLLKTLEATYPNSPFALTGNGTLRHIRGSLTARTPSRNRARGPRRNDSSNSAL